MTEQQPSEHKGTERRKHERKEVITNLSYRVVTPVAGEGLTKNISEGGLCVILDKEIVMGTLLELRFELPGKEDNPVETFAKVIWQKKIEEGFLTGVRFGR